MFVSILNKGIWYIFGSYNFFMDKLIKNACGDIKSVLVGIWMYDIIAYREACVDGWESKWFAADVK